MGKNPACCILQLESLFIKFTLAVGTSCRKISIKLITLLERKPEAEKSRGDVTLLMAIRTSTCETPGREKQDRRTG